MQKSESTSSTALAEQLAAAFAPNSAVVTGWIEAKKTLKPWPQWVFDDDGGLLQVMHDGHSRALVEENEDDFEISVDLMAYADSPELAQNIVEEDMWPSWEKRGYRCLDYRYLDGSTDGWNSELRSWWCSIGKNFGDLDAVIEELRYLARAELVR